MTKEAFLFGLREALAEAPDSVIIENINFYSSYIDGELRKGRSESEVMEELGEPQWIARSILDASVGGRDSGETVYEYGGTSQTFDYDAESGQAHESTGYSDDSYGGAGFRGKFHTLDLSKWYVKALLIAIPILFLLLVLLIIGLFFHMALTILFSPIFWGVLILVTAVSWIFGKR